MSIDFAGSDDYVDCGSGATIDDLFATGGTISCWIKISDTAAARVLGDASGGGSNGWDLIFNTTETLFMRSYWSLATAQWTTDSAMSTDVLVHLTITYNDSSASNDPSFYFNGVSQAITENTAPSGSRNTDAA